MSCRLRKIAFFFLLIFFFFRNFIAFGGEVSLDLFLKLSHLKGDEFASCLVVMKDQANTAQLNFKLNLQKATRKVRHQIITSSLKDKAESSQSEIIDYLNQKILEGSVEKFKPFWITNAILVTATKDQITKIATFPEVEAVYENYPITLVDPVSVERSAGNVVERERCLSAIGAREAWGMGYTGEGRLVCNFDTGVDGDHPAFSQTGGAIMGACLPHPGLIHMAQIFPRISKDMGLIPWESWPVSQKETPLEWHLKLSGSLLR